MNVDAEKLGAEIQTRLESHRAVAADDPDHRVPTAAEVATEVWGEIGALRAQGIRAYEYDDRPRGSGFGEPGVNGRHSASPPRSLEATGSDER